MRKFFLIFSICFVAIATKAQTNLVQENQDSLLNVISYFCKNDTMTYLQRQQELKIVDNDTILTTDVAETFMIIVKDSTDKGYTMEYVPLEIKIDTLDSFKKILAEEFYNETKDLRCIFKTDEYGQVTKIENWREIRDKAKKATAATLDKMFAEPGLDSIMNRKAMENMLTMQYMTEEGVREVYDEINSLFSTHGSAYDIGTKEIDTESKGYPTHIWIKAGYTVAEEDTDLEGDYAIWCRTETKIPTEDMMEIAKGVAGGMVNDNILEQIGDLSDVFKEFKEKQSEITVMGQEFYSLFYNGWPKEVTTSKIVDVFGQKKITINSIRWMNYSWENY